MHEQGSSEDVLVYIDNKATWLYRIKMSPDSLLKYAIAEFYYISIWLLNYIWSNAINDGNVAAFNFIEV